MYDVEQDPPRRPEQPAESKPGTSLLPVVMVVIPLVVLIAGVVAFTGRAGLLVLAVIACLPAFVVLHYLLWGRWLAKSIRDAQRRDDEPPG